MSRRRFFSSAISKKASVFLLTLATLPYAYLQGVELKYDMRFPSPRQLTVEGGFIEVCVEGENRRDLHLRGVIEEVGNESSYEWVVEDHQGELKIRPIAKNNSNTHVDGKLVISMPSDVDLKVVNTSGGIAISHFDSKEASLRSASGKVSLLNCHGKFKVSTASGEINASHVEGALRLRTISGDQHLQQVQGLVVCRTASGQIEVSDVVGDVDIESSCGHVDLANIQGDLEVETKSGSVKIKALKVEDEASVRSLTGNIYLQAQEALENFSMSLCSETGTVSRNGENLGRKWSHEGPKRSIKLSTVSGSIRLEK